MKLLIFLRNNIKRYLVFGIATFIPFYITVILLLKIINFFDNIIKDAVKIFFLPDIFNKFLFYPGIGALLSFIFLVLIGFLSHQYLGGTIMRLAEKIFTLFPISRQIYMSVKKMTESFISQDQRRFKRVVMVPFPYKEVRAIGFVTGVAAPEEDGKKNYYVYVPTAINPTSGFMISIKEDDIIESDLTVEEAFSLILSAGMTASKKKNGE